MKKVTKSRIWELDFLRGFAIIMVVLDHAFYDFSSLFSNWAGCGSPLLEWLNEVGTKYLHSDVRAFWRPAFLFVFFSVSGICTGMSRNNLKRGLKLWVVACGLSLVTFLASEITGENVFILFGVLHCLAIVNLLYALFELILKGVFLLLAKYGKKEISIKVRQIIKCSLCLIISVVFLIVNFEFNIRIHEIESFTKWNESKNALTGMFFYAREWQTGDYFPVFPYIIFFFFGAFLSIFYTKKQTLLPRLDGVWHNVFTVFGRHSLGMYLMGQVVAIGLGLVLSYAILGTAFI